MTRALVLVVLGAFALHVIQGLLLPTPWLLPDEMHAADAARESVRGGFPSLWALLTWPFWAVGTGVGYEVAKVIGAAAVASSAIPTYALARLVAPAQASLVVAAGAVLAPATVIASTAHPAAVAYPLAAAATYFAVRDRTLHAAVLGAVAVALWAPLFLPVLAVGVLQFMRRRSVRALLEWPSAAVLIVVPAAVYAAVAGGRLASEAFRRATDAWQDLPLAAGASLGALAVGLALVPAVVGIAALLRRGRAEEPWASLVAITVVELVGLLVVAALLGLGRTGGGRAADEVALVFVVPILLAAAAGALGRLERRTVVIAAVVVAAAVLLVPGGIDRHAPSLALPDALGLDPRVYAVALVLLGVSVVVALRLTRRRVLAPVLALVALALLVPGELAAWADARDAPDVPKDVDEAAAGRPVTLLADRVDLGLVYSVLFWAPTASIADPPLETRVLNPATGMYQPPLSPGLVLDLVGLRIAGSPVLRTSRGTLVDTGPVARGAESTEGVFPDRWSTGDAYYRRFAGEQKPGVVLVNVSRATWQGPSKRAQVVVSSKPMGGEPFAERITSIDSGEQRVLRIPVPAPPFEVKVAIGPTFSPADYGGTDQRQLGAQLAFDYRPD
jgi:hypothetical protein